MLKNSSYQWWACLRRHLQEQSSSIKFPIVERQSQNLSLKAFFNKLLSESLLLSFINKLLLFIIKSKVNLK